MPELRREFSDVSVSFSRHPGTNDVGKVINENAISQSIRNLILTKNFERPFHSEIGSQVTNLLFENYSPMVTIQMEKIIENVLNNFEPRITVRGIRILDLQERNSYDITVYYSILNTNEELTTNLILERSR